MSSLDVAAHERIGKNRSEPGQAFAQTGEPARRRDLVQNRQKKKNVPKNIKRSPSYTAQPTGAACLCPEWYSLGVAIRTRRADLDKEDPANESSRSVAARASETRHNFRIVARVVPTTKNGVFNGSSLIIHHAALLRLLLMMLLLLALRAFAAFAFACASALFLACSRSRSALARSLAHFLSLSRSCSFCFFCSSSASRAFLYAASFLSIRFAAATAPPKAPTLLVDVFFSFLARGSAGAGLVGLLLLDRRLRDFAYSLALFLASSLSAFRAVVEAEGVAAAAWGGDRAEVDSTGPLAAHFSSPLILFWKDGFYVDVDGSRHTAWGGGSRRTKT